MTIAHVVLEALRRVECEGPVVRLPGSLDEELSARVERVLTAAGASWSIRHRGYAFADLFPFGEAASVIEHIVVARRVVRPQDRGVVSCPQAVAEQMCDEIWDAVDVATVLEPSAGHGALAAEAAAHGAAVDCIEFEAWRAEDITRAGFARSVAAADFLTVEPTDPYDAVLMFPPFRRDLAAAHIVHAHRFLREGGCLAALVSPAVRSGPRRASRELAVLWGLHGWRKVQVDLGLVQTPGAGRSAPRSG